MTKTASTPTWSNVDTTHSTADYCIDADGLSGGRVLCALDSIAGSAASRNTFVREFEKSLLTVDSDGSTQDILSIVATSYTGTSNTIAGICWKEIR